jgi:uncharacterized phage infection (PIP) family protein YhgE
MKSSRPLGQKLLLRLLLVGAIVGFLLGWLGDTLHQYGTFLVFEGGQGPMIGVAVGLLMGIISYAVARRMVLRYVHSLHDDLGQLSDIRPSRRENLNLDGEASALHEAVSTEVSLLEEDRSRLASLVEETRETLRDCSFDSLSRYEDAIDTLDQRLGVLENVREELSDFHQWFDDELRPIMRGRLEGVDSGQLDSFDGMIEFQEELADRVEKARDEVRGLQQVIQPWKDGPEQIRSTINQANEVIGEASEVFEEFPDEDLVNRAEELRRETQSWDNLAERIEQGVQRLNAVSNGVETTLTDLKEQTEDREPPRETWSRIKDLCQEADNKLKRITEASDVEWFQTAEDGFGRLRDETKDMIEQTQYLKQILKEERDQVEEINDLMKRIENIIGSEDGDEKSVN